MPAKVKTEQKAKVQKEEKDMKTSISIMIWCILMKSIKGQLNWLAVLYVNYFKKVILIN